MRDIILCVIVFGSIPFILRRPYYGLLMWIWLSIMNPHRLAYGFAYSMPFAQVAAITFLVSMLLNVRKNYRFPMVGFTVSLLLFMVWMTVSPAVHSMADANSNELDLWLRTFKVLLMVLAVFLVVSTRKEIQGLVWVLTLSIGFYGIKGGLFVIATTGGYRVWGPTGSFVEDNNAIALALVMVVPLFRYLQISSENKKVKYFCIASMVLCLAAAIGSYSRGALLAIAAMSVMLLIKSKNRVLLSVLAIIFIAAIPVMMPDAWFDRMNTINNYASDGSAMGRINAWTMAWNLAVDRVLIGGGFDAWRPENFIRYAPVADDLHVAHSIYFQVLGEHGFVGLLIFLCIFGFAWRAGTKSLRHTRSQGGLESIWASDLASMCQVSLVAYAIGGAFLSLAFYDFPYYVAAILVLLRYRVGRPEAVSITNSFSLPTPKPGAA